MNNQHAPFCSVHFAWPPQKQPKCQPVELLHGELCVPTWDSERAGEVDASESGGGCGLSEDRRITLPLTFSALHHAQTIHRSWAYRAGLLSTLQSNRLWWNGNMAYGHSIIEGTCKQSGTVCLKADNKVNNKKWGQLNNLFTSSFFIWVQYPPLVTPWVGLWLPWISINDQPKQGLWLE